MNVKNATVLIIDDDTDILTAVKLLILRLFVFHFLFVGDQMQQ